MTPAIINNFLALQAEESRLRALTNVELVAECLKTYAADYLVVEEMMNRLDPDWWKEKTEDANG